jgi:hypothetical protein
LSGLDLYLNDLGYEMFQQFGDKVLGISGTAQVD